MGFTVGVETGAVRLSPAARPPQGAINSLCQALCCSLRKDATSWSTSSDVL